MIDTVSRKEFEKVRRELNILGWCCVVITFAIMVYIFFN